VYIHSENCDSNIANTASTTSVVFQAIIETLSRLDADVNERIQS
jgi:hypothetical protein